MKLARSHQLLIVAAIVGSALAALIWLLSSNQSVIEPSQSSADSLPVVSSDGESLGQPLTTDALMPAPRNDAVQPTPTTDDVQRQPASSELQQPGRVE